MMPAKRAASKLTDAHLADLRCSGLTDETIAAAGIRSLSAANVQALFGRDDVGSGLAIPYAGCTFSDGTPYVRVSLDVPLLIGDREARYLTRKGERNRLYIPSILPASVLADASSPLTITEGEKKALKACQEDVPCIAIAGVWCWKTRVGGASVPLPDFDTITWEGRSVVIAFDSDSQTKPSVRAAQEALAADLSARGAQVRLPEIPPDPGGEKVGLDDYLLTRSKEEFRSMVDAAPLWESHVEVGLAVGCRLAASWPDPIAPEAFNGLAGEFIGMVLPHTEADPAALLLSFFVAFGNVVGRGAHFVADGAKHHTNLACVLVGRTARGRKGSSWAQVRRPFETVSSDWAANCIQFGLSSGEGLIWAVRDPIEKREPVREKGRVVDYQEVLEDPGVVDKRLLIVEQEFASTLRVMGRDGNTLSPIIRQAWDSGDLRVLTKNRPAKATGAHISIIGHITREEVLRYLDSTEAGNGFANRFLWVCAQRSKLLPDGGRIQGVDFGPFLHRLAAAVEFARGVGEMARDETARELWHAVYPDLSQEVPGLLGAVIARAEAQTMRLACVYALLDASQVVTREHLEAALAVWGYCEASARFIFGEALGDPTADTILRALRQAANGLTRTEISDLFGRNRRASDISRALGRLHGASLAICLPDTGTGGRPAERWYAVRPGQQAYPQTTEETNETN